MRLADVAPHDPAARRAGDEREQRATPGCGDSAPIAVSDPTAATTVSDSDDERHQRSRPTTSTSDCVEEPQPGAEALLDDRARARAARACEPRRMPCRSRRQGAARSPALTGRGNSSARTSAIERRRGRSAVDDRRHRSRGEDGTTSGCASGSSFDGMRAQRERRRAGRPTVRAREVVAHRLRSHSDAAAPHREREQQDDLSVGRAVRVEQVAGGEAEVGDQHRRR